MKKTRAIVFLVILFVVFILWLFLVQHDSTRVDNPSSLIGKWISELDEEFYWTLREDGTFDARGNRGTYAIDGSTITFTGFPKELVYSYTISGDTLIFSNDNGRFIYYRADP